MRISHRRAAVHCLTAFALSAAALTGCSGSGGSAAGTESSASATAPSAASPSSASSAPAGEAEATTGADGGEDPGDTPASTGAASWAGTKQFVQIEDAWTSGGRTYVSVRPARKKAILEPSEAWVVVPGEGPWTEVPMAEDARVLLSVPLGDDSRASSYSQAEFVSRLAAQPDRIRPHVGYDLSFDGDGRVTRLKSLYTS